MKFQRLNNGKIGLFFPKDEIESKSKQYSPLGKEPLECSYIEYRLVFRFYKENNEEDAKDILDRCLQEGVANGILEYDSLTTIGSYLEQYYNDKHNKLTQGHYPRDFYEPLAKNTRYAIEIPDFTTKGAKIAQQNIFKPTEKQLPYSYFWIEIQCSDKEMEMYVCICDILDEQFPRLLKDGDGNFYIEGKNTQAFLEIYRVFGSLSRSYGKHVMLKLTELIRKEVKRGYDYNKVKK